ncbi:MAG: hypothetical protein L7G99_07300 [Vulcanisaeta sp.]|nr:hypothetical protein [Vulcanisaeta sp.]
MSAKSLVVSVILYVMGRVRSRARGGDPISNAKHYIEILGNTLRSAGVDPSQVSNLLESQEVPRYIGVAIGGSVVDQGECDVNKPLRIPFIRREVSVGPALLMNVVINGARARDDYGTIVNELDKYVESLGGLRLDWELLITTLISIAKSTLTYVPYSTCGDGNTYSAYAVAHAAAAYASTAFSKDKYVIVVADIVGIQDIISRINRTEKAMRQLKGRSILINLLQHAVATRLIRDINRKLGVDALSPVNVLVNTGGEVVMLIPAIDEDVLNGVIEELEDEVAREFEGRVRVVVARSRVHSISDNFGDALGEAYGERDNRRYGRWKKFIINGKDLCDMCHMPTERPIRVDNQTLCPFCALAHRIGGVSRRLGTLAEVASPVNQPGCESMSILGINYVVCLEGVRLGVVPRIIYDLDRLSISSAINAGHALFFLNTRMPTDEFGELKSFEDLGSVAVTVKSDANKMGDLKSKVSKLGAAQYVLFSQLLITIFDAYGAMLYMNTPNYSDSVFIVYSGGDDLVVVGNHYALDYLVRIVKRANEFGINVASGAMVHDARLPIYLVWHDTEERLNRAKDMGRDESLVYLLDTGKSPVILNIDRVRDVVNYIEQRHAWAGELEGEEGEASRTLMYKVTTHLTRMYDLLWEMREVLRDKRGSKDLTRLNELRRGLVREVINYVYLINRNSRNAQGILNELPKNLHPSNIASTLAPILRSQDNQQEALKALDGLLNDLGVIVARINLYRQLLEKQQTMPT